MANFGYIQLCRVCNQKCLFCSNPDNGNHIAYDDAIAVINDFVNNKYQGLFFTGGEPTLSPILLDLIKYAKDRGLEPRIITNGQKTAELSYLESLLDNGLGLMHVSVHSIDPKVQDYLTQNNGSLRNVLRSLVNARQLGLPVNINMVINSYNAKSLDKNIQFFLKKFPEIRHFVFNNLDPEMNRVAENKFVVPKLADFKNSLNRALTLIKKNGKSFRVERVPLCYLDGFEEFSTETRKIVKTEERSILFLDDRKNPYARQKDFFYKKGTQCDLCSLKDICAGLYAMNTYYDEAELKFSSKDKVSIINKILDDDK